MLREAGIEVSVQNGRSYRGGRRGTFSYRDSPESPKAAVLYVTHKGDLPEARRLLREAGLIEPSQRESYLSPELRFAVQAAEKKKGLDIGRIRTILLLLIVATIALFSFFGPSLAV
jgi:hypothetical protein